MHISLKNFLKGEQIDSKFCVGKAVKDLYFNYGRFCIIFDDNTFCFMEECDIDGEIGNILLDESSVINDIKYDSIEETFSFGNIIGFLVKNGLFNEDELIANIQSMKEEENDKLKYWEIREYNRIKEKYNLK